MTTMPPIVTVDELADHPDAIMADVRWYLDGRDAHTVYESGHLPGAIFVDLEHDLAAATLAPFEGRHPLPDPQTFAAAMGRLGIGDDSTVIAYDDTGGMTAGRLVVMLRMIGRNAAVLDGGLRSWRGEMMTGSGATREIQTFTPCEWPIDRLADANETAAMARSELALVIDARAFGRFTGDITQVDPRPGHIPGAKSAPWTDVVDPDTHRFRSDEELREHFHALGVNKVETVIASCGSGVSACMNILAMEQAGFPPARLYVASFSGWSADPEHDVETGP